MNCEFNSIGIKKKPSDTTVVVAMSGGVDSSTVAGMMKKEGYKVIGITLKLYDDTKEIAKSKQCCAGQDIMDAKRVANKLNIDEDIIYNTASWGIIGGIIGARFVHIADNLDYYLDNPIYFLYIWKGGIALWGGILGGWIGGVSYALYRKFSYDFIGQLMDFAAPAMLSAQAIGRIGDIINGEHCSRATDLFFGWYFTHPESPGLQCIGNSEVWSNGHFPRGTELNTPVHPAALYEFIWDILGLVLLVVLRGKLKPLGSLWFVYLAWYSFGRFIIQWIRLDRVYFLGFQEAHFISLVCFVLSVIIIGLKTRRNTTN